LKQHHALMAHRDLAKTKPHGVLQRHRAQIAEVRVSEAAVDIDTPGDFQKLQDRSSLW
jgi:CTP:molybdopterin cytidylyltransferase MocA